MEEEDVRLLARLHVLHGALARLGHLGRGLQPRLGLGGGRVGVAHARLAAAAEAAEEDGAHHDDCGGPLGERAVGGDEVGGVGEEEVRREQERRNRVAHARS